MAYLLQADTPDGGTATWVPGGAGGLQDWSEDVDGNLFPNTTFDQSLGTFDNSVLDVWANQVTLRGTNGPDPGTWPVPQGYPGIVLMDDSDDVGSIVRSYGALAGGRFVATGAGGGGSIVSRGAMAIALGVIAGPGGASTFIAASQAYDEGRPSVAFGYILVGPSASNPTASVEATSTGLAFGSITMTGADYDAKIRADAGLAFGAVLTGGMGAPSSVYALQGSLAHGVTAGGLIEATGSGAHAGGYIGYPATSILATGHGAFAHGYVSSATYGAVGLRAIGNGSFVFGAAYESSSYITATGDGAFAGGQSLGYTISASADGAFAFGTTNSGAGGGIYATAGSAGQIGPGTNNAEVSWKVGNDTYGIRILGSGLPSARNGDIWCDGTDVFVRTGGVTKNMSDI